MRDRKAEETARFAARSAQAAEQAAEHAAMQAAIAREQTNLAKGNNRRTTLIVVASFLGVAAATVTPFAVSLYEESSKDNRIYKAHIDMEVANAVSLKDVINDVTKSIGPTSNKSVSEIRRDAELYHDMLRDADAVERQHELKEDRDAHLDDVYIERRHVFERIDRMLRGAVVQAQYNVESPAHKGLGIGNWVFAVLNANMALNIYVASLKDAADAHKMTIPDHLWIVSPTATGPMVDDSQLGRRPTPQLTLLARSEDEQVVDVGKARRIPNVALWVHVDMGYKRWRTGFPW